jgi:nucleoid-associated protein YgaU
VTAIVVRRTAADTEAQAASARKMFIATEDRSLFVMVPFAARVIDYSNRARIHTQIERPGRSPILAVGGVPLPTMSYDLFFGDRDGGSVEADLHTLEQIAQSGMRVVVNYGPGEAGLWRITAFSYSSANRSEDDQSISQAVASIELTRASDYNVRVGPLTGGSSTAPPKSSTRVHIVAKGDTLGSISRKYYGTNTLWRFLADANKIRHPKRTKKLKPGRKLTIPPRRKK